jgi:selenocysteine lyase/cysteine desulfurase
VVAFTAKGRSPTELASALSERDLVASGGLQCAPLAHETLRTAPEGVLRISFGPGNEDGDEEIAVAALREILG